MSQVILEFTQVNSSFFLSYLVIKGVRKSARTQVDLRESTQYQGWWIGTTCDDFSVVYYFAPLSFVCSSAEQQQRNWLACPILAALITGQDFMNDWGLRVGENSTFKHRYNPVSEEIQPLMRNRGISAMVNYGIVWGGGNLVEG